MSLWHAAIAVTAGLILVWIAMVAVLYALARREDEPVQLREVLRLVPDVLRLLRRLAADPDLPRGVRWRLSAVVVYLILPIDLVPDFIPIVGYADDAVVVALGLRWVIRAAGVGALDRHWTGTPQGLAVLKRLAGCEAPQRL
ncbi:MAG TPA: DUF1232 domain-containing protein [Nocardioides sp.]|jgi:uncharacterized membrane protein YkvA (DUF1232 family)|nr:DUF1232 domain-containing protein [Nocardioides sp.]